MFDVIKKLLLARQLSFEEGEIKLLGQSVTMTPVTIYIEMLKELKKANPTKYKQIIYNITKEGGRKYTETLKQKYNIKKPLEMVKWDLNTLALAGLGKGQILKYDAKTKSALIKIINSPIANGLKPSKESVDLIIAGYTGGSATIIFNSKTMECKETKCQAMGDPFCLFEVFESK